ncbi:S-Ena type endospore appendage [Paenibacillus humicus]|uniref:S-Ena type endospore appendage n=1 Tax=Paenibacillus humicus TaxID=412861 RepID=UPI003D2D86D7
MVQDKVCSNFLIAVATPRIIYTSVGVDARNLFASGTITYADGTAPISVQFFLGTIASGPSF